MNSENSPVLTPAWLEDVLGISSVDEGTKTSLKGHSFVMRDGILRSETLTSSSQTQTEKTFGFKWHQRDTFESEASLKAMREWLIERYGEVAGAPWWQDHGPQPLVIDAGCGAAMSAIELFGERINQIRFLGIEISAAVDVAAARMAEKGFNAGFLQTSLMDIPLEENSVDVIFSEGVLHHTDSTKNALLSLAKLLKPGGRFLFYVYKTKGPIREFTDDYVRDKLQGLPPEEAWEKMMPLSRLGKLLGDLDIELDIPEEIEMLEIPKGKISLQRFFYWHVFKAFYRPEMTLDEMNHINFDWYAPVNAHRQTLEEVRQWCGEGRLEIEREVVQEAGITIIARKH